ncbi:MAG: class I SAM-dependent methyltransferase [Bacteroidales bacterium]|nr:class I SAM-dependent methyltransferase [Bacteroidales bacterium]
MKGTDLLKILIWEFYNPKILKFRRRKRVVFNPEFRGINLGSGFSNPPHWLGIDGGASIYMLQRSPNFLVKLLYKSFDLASEMSFEEYVERGRSVKYLHHDIRNGLPLYDESVPNIYSSHFLEHLPKEDAVNVLNECFRVLKSGGMIRIMVPSLDEAAEEIRQALKEYEAGETDHIQKYVTQEQFGYIKEMSCHRWMYNAASLGEILANAGFKQVTECSRGTGRMIDVDKLDTRDGLVLEAVKE